MKRVLMIDQTLCQAVKADAQALSFREKMEIAKLIAKMHPDVLDAGEIKNEKADAVLLHAIAPELGDIVLSCRCQLNENAIDTACKALSAAQNAAVRLMVPSSPVRMEYEGHRKAPQMLETLAAMTKYAAEKGVHVAVCFDDATRAERDFLVAGMKAAAENGAACVQLQDVAGTMLPDEFAAFVSDMRAQLPENVKLIVACSDEMSMAVAGSMAAVLHGADGVCCAVGSSEVPSAAALAHALHLRGDACGISCSLNHTELQRAAERIADLLSSRRSASTPFDGAVRDEADEEKVLDSASGISAVAAAVKARGYDLSQDDVKHVAEAIEKLPANKEVTGRELDAIIASSAMQVPPTYKLVSYHVNCSNIIAPTAHVVLKKDGRELQGLSVGDGPIDAAFLAIEQIAGRHFELDDFQIQAVTEGRGAMGDALVKLRHEGRLYSGKGLSTDILGAAMSAYINALNKIAYEENNA